MFSLKSLLFMVAVAAVGAAGLIYRTQFWASTIVGLTLVVLILAGCRTWFSPQFRSFWGPFTATGALYLSIVSLQPLRELHYNLPTTQLVVMGLEKLQESYAAKAAAAQLAAPGPVASYVAPPYVAPPTVYFDPGTTNAFVTSPQIAGQGPVSSGATLSGGSLTFQYASPPPVVESGSIRPILFQTASSLTSSGDFPSQARAFLWVAQCLWSLLLAMAAGISCSWLFRPAAA